MLAPWKSLLSRSSVPTAPLYMPLKAINMCLASTFISVSSVLNFSLAALLAVIWDWQVLGVWFSPLVCLVYVPCLLQAGIVSSLSP